MKQFLLALLLIAVPVAGFSAVEIWLIPTVPDASATVVVDPLGDLAAYETIVADTSVIAGSGDLAAAEKRITDFETAWDAAESTLRAKDAAAWGNIDTAADDALDALRKGTPDASSVKATLVALAAMLANPLGSGAASGPAQNVAGIAVTDVNGHALPCEAMLGELRTALADGSIAAADKPAATGLQTKATERCNADDDKHADALAAQALALAAH